MNKRTLSRLTWIALVVIMICGASVLAGCMTNAPPGGPNSSEGTPAPTISSVRLAPGSVNAVDFNLLIPFLPDAPAGWTADTPEGVTMNETGIWTIASRSYSNSENQQAEVSIMDSAYYDVGAWEVWGNLTETSTGDGYIKGGTVAGFPSWESYDNSSGSYETWVGLNNRFMVTVSINSGKRSDLDLFLNMIQYPDIAALK